MSSPPEIITITEQPIELCKLLKIANMVGGGGEAKIVISEGYVFLNGEVEYRKRKKVVDGDIVEFNGEVIQVEFDASLAPPPPIKTDVQGPKAKAKKKKSETPSNVTVAKQNKRKPISF